MSTKGYQLNRVARFSIFAATADRQALDDVVYVPGHDLFPFPLKCRA
jgi:hypothetical protein